ncbi:hypothetical protein FOC1_g10007649 [Fusarium oxysporum f. sp. cubense race 1]|uniref:Peptidase S8/S53 domain-containing protein n=1 Tax=Fusarium oxysporum f. sp. cubense (strain race 1) TaxID=1229664 RepID=N4UJ84_FUSC1|nr:hypothetical protein FOC1_g10007649 [Fusarium oxysporum f. sp. cubense race 1]
MNKDGQTPISMAIRTRQDQLLDYMISACVSHKKPRDSAQNLNTALCSKHDGKPCLHAAFGEKLKPETMKMLIENASDEALSMTDMERLGKPKSAKTFLDISDQNGCSVFQEHANTRKTYMKQYRTAQAAQRRKKESKETQKEAERAPPRETRLHANTRESKTIPTVKAPGDRDAERCGRSSGPAASTDDRERIRQQKKEEERDRLKQAGAPAINDRLRDRDATERDRTRPEREAESEKRVVKPSSSSKKNPDFQSALKNREKNSHIVLQKLKLYYMRTRNAEMVMFFLYGKNMDDIQIGFDYRVRHIIKLSVEDSGDSGQKVHSDEVIQSALEKFVIEHLDWQKTDLDPETILHISSKRLAVEKTYDSPHWINQRIMEFERRLNKNRESPHEAQLRISDSLSFSGNKSGHIRVKLVDPATGSTLGVASNIVSPTTISTPDQGVNEDRWLRSIENFASAMAPYWEDTVTNFLETRQNSGTTERVESDVVIALVDDGVDKFEIGRPDQVLEGKSFDFHDERVNPPYLSAQGHGTTMASMILRVCPMAKVYPIRLKTYNSADGKSTIDPRYAARAIQAALDKNATIISMSRTLPIESGKDHMKEELHAVLKRAVENKVLMFCSAPDKGKFTELDYPSGPWPNSFFRIGAAYSNGTVFQWTPEVGITYILPGVDVVQDQIKGGSSKSGEGSKSGKNLTGSSVATALGAGLAAMIIYCVKASILSVKTANQNKAAIHPIPDDRAIQVAKPDAMKRAFASLGSTPSNKFIQVWEELDKARVILERWERENSIPEANLKCTQEFMQFGIKLTSSVKQ